MRSMYRFSIIALAVASLALIAAGSAFADYKIGGAVTGGFGQITTSLSDGAGSSDSSSQLTTQSEAVMDLSATAGAVSLKIRHEVTEGGITDNQRHYVKWNITDAFSVSFNGSSFGSEAGSAPFGATVVGHLTSLAGPGHYAGVEQWVVGGVNDADTDINFKTGNMNLGAVIAGDWDLRGGGTAVSELMTVVPYFNGHFGAISVHVYLASASGKDAGDTSVKANETSVAGIYKAGGLKLALQYLTGKYLDTTKTTGINFGGGISGITFHYISDVEEPDAGGDPTKDVTDIAVAYTAPINDGAEWSIGYGMLTNNLDSALLAAGDVESQSQIIFSVRGKY